MNTVDPNDPRRRVPERDIRRQGAFNRDGGYGTGTASIIGIVLVAALIIAGMLYLMQSPPETPAGVTSQGPSTTTQPAPASKTPGAAPNAPAATPKTTPEPSK